MPTTAIMRRHPELNLEEALNPTDIGRLIDAWPLRDGIWDETPVGKLLQGKYWYEITDNDGEDGQPLWVAIGKFVYDLTCKLTAYPFPSTAYIEI
jgi:hypothetical protein